jgi:hypothetical protein
LQFSGLADPVVLFHTAFALFQRHIDARNVFKVESGNLCVAVNFQLMQGMFEDLADADDLLQVVTF